MIKNMNIKTRFYVLIGFSSLMLVWVGMTGLSGINTSNAALSSVYNNQLTSIDQLNEIRNNQMQIRLALANARFENDPFEVVAHADRINGLIFKIENLMKAYEARGLTVEEKKLFDAFVKARLNFGRTGVMPLIELLQSEKYAEADTHRKSVMEPAYAGASVAIDDLLKYQVDHAKEEYEKSTTYANRIRIISIGSIAISLTLSILAGLFIARAIAYGIGKLVEGASSLASGNLATRVDIQGGCELAQLASAFNKMAADFSSLLGQVQQASASVADTSVQLTSTAGTVSQGSHSQSEAAANVAAAAESLNQSIRDVAERSDQATAAAVETRELATDGQKVVNQATEGIRAIAQTFNESGRLVDALGQRSQQIGQIVDVIKDIADQTNLLALNAAIEAARAGEQGRGFAVVADEVRKLAERTANATAEISTMITAIQSETGNTVNNMETGSQQVEAGVELAARAGESLRQINESIERVTEMIRQTAAATHEQGVSSGEISRRVDDIARMAQENNAAIGQTADATRGLQGLSSELHGLVSRFRLS